MKGIMFEPVSVIGILEDRKTMTRRLIDPQPKFIRAKTTGPGEWKWKGWHQGPSDRVPIELAQVILKSARYHVGETVYVKETWMTEGADVREAMMKSGKIPPGIIYRATDKRDLGRMFKWRSPMMMPEWASRQKILITAARVERVGGITEEDATAEGCGLEMLRSLIEPLAAKAKTSDRFWVEHNESGGSEDSGDYCRNCINQAHRKAGVRKFSKRYDVSPESDSCKHCETCGMILDYTLTDYGCEEEWRHFQEHGMKITPDDAYHVDRILCGGQTLPKNCSPGALAKFCYQAIWDSINPDHSFASNPFVIAYSFEKVKIEKDSARR